jgi:hypothetical protein
MVGGYRIFYKITGADSKSTMQHIGFFLAQMGEASTLDFMNIQHFPLSLTDSSFSWFTSLAACSISS